MYVDEETEALLKKMCSLPISYEKDIHEFLDYLIYRLEEEDNNPNNPWYSEANQQAILRSLQQVKEGKLTEHELLEA